MSDKMATEFADKDVINVDDMKSFYKAHGQNLLFDFHLQNIEKHPRETKRQGGIASLLAVRSYFKIRVRNLAKKP